MRTCVRSNVLLIIGLVWVCCGVSLQAAPPPGDTPIYANDYNDLSTRFPLSTNEVGDQIILAPGTSRYLTYFDFEYYGVNTLDQYSFAGAVEARVRFYQNSGSPFHGYDTPSNLFYDSGWFGGLIPTDTTGFRATIYFTSSDWLAYAPGGGGKLFIPADEMTWSVQFRGMEATDTVGLDIYSPPNVGQNYADYWENNGTGWTLLTNGVPMNFGARMYVPEPSSLMLSLVGGLSILVLARRFHWKD